MTPIAAIMALALTASALASETADRSTLEALDLAKARWNSRAASSMTYTVRIGGVFGGADHKVTIRNGRCKAISRSTHARFDAFWRPTECTGLRIPDLFAELRRQLVRGTVSHDVRFNSTFGYIEELTLEPKTNITDQAGWVEMKRFRVYK